MDVDLAGNKVDKIGPLGLPREYRIWYIQIYDKQAMVLMNKRNHLKQYKHID